MKRKSEKNEKLKCSILWFVYTITRETQNLFKALSVGLMCNRFDHILNNWNNKCDIGLI